MRYAPWLSIVSTFVIIAAGLAQADVRSDDESKPHLPSPVPVLNLEPTDDGGLAPSSDSLNALTTAVPYDEQHRARMYSGPAVDGVDRCLVNREGHSHVFLHLEATDDEGHTIAGFTWTGFGGEPDTLPGLSMSVRRRTFKTHAKAAFQLCRERLTKGGDTWSGSVSVDDASHELTPATTWDEFVTANRKSIDDLIIPELARARESMPAIPEFPWTDEPDAAPHSP